MDAGARAELRRGLSRHLAAFAGTCLVITHDPIEAMTLGDQLVVLEAGPRRAGRHARRSSRRTRARATWPTSSA